MELRERQITELKKARPTDSIDPIVDSLPVSCIFLVNLENALNDCRGFRPTRRIVRNARSNQLLKTGFATGIGVIATNPNGQFGVFGIVNLHGRTRGIARTAANTLLLVHF